MKRLYLPIEPFLWHPERIALVAALFFAAFVIALIQPKKHPRLNAWALLWPALFWGLFVPWEAYCKAGAYYIRVDLVLIYPLLVIVTIGGIIGAFKKKKKKQQPMT